MTDNRKYTRGPMSGRIIEALDRGFSDTIDMWELEYLERVCRQMVRLDRVLDIPRKDFGDRKRGTI